MSLASRSRSFEKGSYHTVSLVYLSFLEFPLCIPNMSLAINVFHSSGSVGKKFWPFGAVGGLVWPTQLLLFLISKCVLFLPDSTSFVLSDFCTPLPHMTHHNCPFVAIQPLCPTFTPLRSWEGFSLLPFRVEEVQKDAHLGNPLPSYENI